MGRDLFTNTWEGWRTQTGQRKKWSDDAVSTEASASPPMGSLPSWWSFRVVLNEVRGQALVPSPHTTDIITCQLTLRRGHNLRWLTPFNWRQFLERAQLWMVNRQHPGSMGGRWEVHWSWKDDLGNISQHPLHYLTHVTILWCSYYNHHFQMRKLRLREVL